MASARDIALAHFDKALEEGAAQGIAADTIARYTLTRVLETYLASRDIEDVRQELLGAAENLDPDTDFPFMRP